MLTPQDVQEKTFAKAVFGGYDMASVDDFLETVSADYAALYKENAILKSKLKILVDKVEEYRSTESAMRQALLDTQKKCDDMIDEAKKESDSIAAQAELEAMAQREMLSKEVHAEEKRLEAAKEKTAEYVNMVNALCQQQIDFMKNLSGLEIKEELPVDESRELGPNDEEWVNDAAREIELSLQRLEVQQAAGQTTGEALHDDEAASGEETKVFRRLKDEEPEHLPSKPRFNFENLQFGSNYNADTDD